MIVFLFFMSDKKLSSKRSNLDVKTLIHKLVNRFSDPNCHKFKIELIDFDSEIRSDWIMNLLRSSTNVGCNEWNYRLFPLSLFSFQSAKLHRVRCKQRVETFFDQYLRNRNPQYKFLWLAHSSVPLLLPLQCKVIKNFAALLSLDCNPMRANSNNKH